MLEAQPAVLLPPRAPRRPLWLVEVVLIGTFYAMYAWIRDEHGKVGERSAQQRAADAHATAVLHLEHRLHLDPERALQSLVPHDGAYVHAINGFYLIAHVTVTVSVLVALFVARPAAYRRCRSVLLAISATALVVFAVYPTAPPRLLPASHLRDTLSVGGWWSLDHGGIERIADPYAAMPSLHLAWATWCALAVAHAFPTARWRRLVALYPALVAWVVLSTGAHWLLDAVAGVALALAGWWLSGRRRPWRSGT